MSYSNKVVVGISSRSSQKDLQWLMDFIRRTFWEVVSDVRYLPITNKNAIEWEAEVRRCSVGILYHTKHQGRLNIVDVDGALYNDELQSLCRILGKSKVLVVLDDLENCPDSERQRILDAQPSLRHFSSQLLLFPEKDKDEKAYKRKEEFLKILGNNAAPRIPQANTAKSIGSFSLPFSLPSIFTFDKSSETSSHSKQKAVTKSKPPNKSSLKISIFSRSAPTNYEWLMDSLKMNMMRSVDICAVQITNNSTNFYSELRNCSFAILYHTQNQGRLNITDVTDALYNEELKELSNRLGKDNVIVVIDHLQNANTTEKNRILEGQPSIGRLAQDLYLFNKKIKNSEHLENIKRSIVRKMQKNEVMNPDFRQDTAERKSDTYSKEQDFHSAQGLSCSDSSDLGEPKAKRLLVDLSMLAACSSQALAEVERTFQDARSSFFSFSEKLNTTYTKLEDYKKAFQADYRVMEQEMQKLQSQNEDLQRTNSNLLKQKRESEDAQNQLLEANSQTIQEKQHTIERLHKDLSDRDRIIERRDERMQVMEQEIQELQKKLREKEELQKEEGKARKETPLTGDTFQKDLDDRTLEENRERIQKLEEENQQLKNCIQKMEDKSRQEQAGQNWRHGMENQESQQYEEKSPISWPEDDEMTPCEHRSCSEDTKHGESNWDRTQRHRDTVCNQWPNPTEIQSPISEDNLIKQLNCTIQKKDKEIRRLNSILEYNTKFIEELLSASESGKEKAASGSKPQLYGRHITEF
ncbi:golgin subfamily A member 6-like protein 7 [Eleutherodactylus coqui]|uniref:golgin subfamily A member 6-like protein 7 n=1 Tax=Eleutherodactylus coqui TaxID=57060 RepID=UPI0034627E0F